MIWANPREVILYARSSNYYNNMFIIYLFSDIILIYKLFWSLIQKKMWERLPLRYVHDVIMFSVAGSMLKIYFT